MNCNLIAAIVAVVLVCLTGMVGWIMSIWMPTHNADIFATTFILVFGEIILCMGVGMSIDMFANKKSNKPWG